MKKKFLTFLTLTLYMLLSILSSNNDVLCIHENGFSSFESIINSNCTDINSLNEDSKISLLENKKNIQDNDKCCDIEILKGIISYSPNIFTETLLSYNIVITGYIDYLTQQIFKVRENNYVYLALIKNHTFTETSYCNHISTFVLLT